MSITATNSGSMQIRFQIYFYHSAVLSNIILHFILALLRANVYNINVVRIELVMLARLRLNVPLLSLTSVFLALTSFRILIQHYYKNLNYYHNALFFLN